MFLFLFFGLAVVASEEPEVRFGLIADIQYADKDARINRHYRESLPKLEKCVETLNKANVEFTLNLGDLVDESIKDLPPVLEKLKKLEAPFYNTTGNHDYGDVTDNDVLYKQLSMPAEYYSVKQGGWRFILLNTNEIASYANIKGTAKEQEHKAMRERIRKDGKSNGASYNGGISKQQLQWLKKELEAASQSGEKVIVCSHHPLFPAKGYTALNGEEILDLLIQYPCVQAVLSGHHHSGAFGKYRELPCITLEGMVETEETSSYAIVELYKDALVLKGHDRTKSRRIPLAVPAKNGASGKAGGKVQS